MTKKNKLRIAFVITLVAGIALFIGGFFLEPLFAPAAALLAGAAGFYQGAFAVEVNEHEIIMHHEDVPQNITFNIDNRHVTFTPMFEMVREPIERPPHPTIERQEEELLRDTRKTKSAPQLTLS
jgi:hypothetical protein